MKTKFKHILVILCLSMISCEGNLEPELFDQITPENFLTNEDDVRLLSPVFTPSSEGYPNGDDTKPLGVR